MSDGARAHSESPEQGPTAPPPISAPSGRAPGPAAQSRPTVAVPSSPSPGRLCPRPCGQASSCLLPRPNLHPLSTGMPPSQAFLLEASVPLPGPPMAESTLTAGPAISACPMPTLCPQTPVPQGQKTDWPQPAMSAAEAHSSRYRCPGLQSRNNGVPTRFTALSCNALRGPPSTTECASLPLHEHGGICAGAGQSVRCDLVRTTIRQS